MEPLRIEVEDSAFDKMILELQMDFELQLGEADDLVDVDFSELKSSFLIDIEAYGKSPFSGKLTEFGIASLASRNWLRAVVYETAPNPDNPAQPLPVSEKPVYRVTVGYDKFDLAQGRSKSFRSLADMLLWVNEWLKKQSGESDRLVFISDNNGYDYSWFNYLYDSAGLDNPFGHSSRRIGDFAAGVSRIFTQTSKWKQLRDVAHTHESHWDAQGNAGALRILLRISQTVEAGQMSVVEAYRLGRKESRENFVK